MTLDEKLDRLGKEWCAGRDAMTPEEKQRWTGKIFELIAERYPAGTLRGDAIGEFFIKAWPRFDAEKGKLSSYAGYQLQKLSEQMKHRDQGDHYVVNPEKGEGKPKRIWVNVNDSLSQKTGEDGPEQGDRLKEKVAVETHEEKIRMDETIFQLLSLILELPTRLRGRANNPQRHRYYRMFFTDSSVDIIHSSDRLSVLIDHERDFFQTMILGFLDFFMNRTCRTVAEISNASVKLYGEMVSGGDMKKLGHPLPNDVYLAYLNNVEGLGVNSSSTISEMRGNYRQLLEANLC